jgi:hypothetical protein
MLSDNRSRSLSSGLPPDKLHEAWGAIMQPKESSSSGPQELARRVRGAVEVTLFWVPGAAKATVSVWNWASGACLQLDVEPSRARYAFDHPYAYAAELGIPERDVVRAA